jgi:hypothetical protein
MLWLPSQAAWRTTDYPVISRFVRESPEAGNRIQTDFYNMRTALDEVSNSIKNAELNHDSARIKELTTEHPEWSPAVRNMLDAEGKTLGKQRKQLSTILQNPGYTAEAKRKALDDFYVKRDAQMDKLAPLLGRLEKGTGARPG